MQLQTSIGHLGCWKRKYTTYANSYVTMVGTLARTQISLTTEEVQGRNDDPSVRGAWLNFLPS
ncbi:hypothetical protein SAY87_026109 [Trapa incisa]|uniref:Uncharacterized protein n=1 Tax=Trapa incisa TaxID=236973 RepID=A0AAN7H241_9MYRT|nr:hypothetical protein SAY87_026109 [Trapa incisa]